MSTPAEQKERTRETKSIFVNILLASIMIGFALITTLFDFESLTSQVSMAVLIIVSTLIVGFLLVRWLKSLDEYESQVNAQASMIALYSSLLYLPLQYLNKIGLLPEIHIAFFFMYLWIVYLIAIKLHHSK